MRRYVDTARRYRWFILLVLALTWLPGAALAFVEYTTSYEADATIWTQRTSQQFATTSAQDPGLTTFVTPASEQAGVLIQLLQTRSFLLQIVQRTSLRVPESASDERKFFDEFSKRFRVEVLGTNLFRLSYRARDPHTGPEVVLAALALMPASALAQNGYSFTDASESMVRYGVSATQAAMSCASVPSLATAETGHIAHAATA